MVFKKTAWITNIEMIGSGGLALLCLYALRRSIVALASTCSPMLLQALGACL